MSNKNKYIPLHGGKECKLKNPHRQYRLAFKEPIISPEWQDFEANNPPIPLTEVMPEGETFEGVEVEIKQYKFMDLEWVNCTGYYTFMRCNDDGIPTRIITAIKPLKAKEPEFECQHINKIIGANGMYAKCKDCGVLLKSIAGTWEVLPARKEEDAMNLPPEYHAKQLEQYIEPAVDVVENKETSALEDMFRNFIRQEHLTGKWDEFMLNYPNAHKIVEQSQSIEGIVSLNEYVDKLEGLLLNLRHHAGLSDSNIEWIDRVINENPTSLRS